MLARLSLRQSVLLFLILFSICMALLIFARETWDQYDVLLLPIILWQLAIWVPWALVLKPLELLGEKLGRGYSTKNISLIAGVMILLVGIHCCYFFVISNSFSPIQHLPRTAYGVYPYFFIFFAMIDVLIVWGLSSRIGILQMLDEPPSDPVNEIITVKQGANTILVRPQDIQWISAEDYYSKLHTNNGDYMLRQPLKVLLDRLRPDKFVQVHRSTIVNLDFVEESNGSSVTLRDGATRKMSRQGQRRFARLLEEPLAAQ